MKLFDMLQMKGQYKKVLRQHEIDNPSFYQTRYSKFVEMNCPACGIKGVFSFRTYGLLSYMLVIAQKMESIE